MKIKSVHILMYHYVREIQNSKYPKIKGVEFEIFKEQLDYLKSNFNIISGDDLMDFFLQKKDLPNNPCLLTFDDGYKEHKTNVLPELLKRNIKGVFFPPAKAILERDLLDANAIHYILADESSDKILLKKIFNFCNEKSIDLETINNWKKNNFITNDKFDSAERILIKRLLQYLLPNKIRKEIISKLFKEKTGLSCQDFAENFYLNIEDINDFINEGMCIGGHGYNHERFSLLSYNDQKEEIDKTYSFLRKINPRLNKWIMCYPYGDYNQDTISILSKSNCALAFRDVGKKTILDSNKRYELARYDVKDFFG